MAKTAAGPAKRKGAKASQETGETARSNWRTPPAKPRKRVRQYAATAQGLRERQERKARGERQPLRVPSRREVLSYLRATGLALLVCAIAVGMYQLLRLPALAVRLDSTQIGGAQRIPAYRIYEASGAEGRNVFLIQAGEVQSRVLGLPGIAGATVHLRLPNAMIIDVVEHAPLVAWQGITTTVWLAEDGAEVPQAGDEPPLRLADQTRADLAESRKLWRLILKNLAELHAADPAIRELAYGKTEGLYYRTPEGWQVWLGDSGPIKAKLALVTAAQQEIARQGKLPRVIDVRLSGRRALYW